MKQKKKIGKAIVLAIFASFFLGVPSQAAEGVAPGSQEDPLVSKSYVDEKISQIVERIVSLEKGQSKSNTLLTDEQFEGIVTDVVAQVQFLNATANETTSDGYFHPVFINRGKIITGDEGTELILRSGKAVAYATDNNGVVDLTTGVDLSNGKEVALNHLVIIPRKDGRGVRCTADSWFMIKGNFAIH